MAEIGKFTQPDASPKYFIDFLDFLDKREAIQNMRAESAKRLSLAPGHKVLDLGSGIGGATIPLAEITGPAGLAAGVDISSAMIEVATQRAWNFESAKLARFLMLTNFLTRRVARECFYICRTGWRRFTS
jgi:ubiquinone/menaquinone biosynthesis C-methylase UbiE